MTLPPFMPADFHFLRPLWLLAVLPAVILAILAWRRIGSGRNDWQHLVDAHLLRHLMLREATPAGKWPVAALLAGWVLAALAMAGPTWQQLPTPVLDRLDPTVVVLSLAQSMNATDQNPSRLTAARHKVDDILNRMRGGQVGLVIYADAPFVASPLTEDGRVVAQMLPELATDLMPVMDDRPDLAIRSAIELLKNAGARTGRIILLTDDAGDSPEQSLRTAKLAARDGYTVSIIGVGTPEGSPLIAYDGGVLRARDGAVQTTRLDEGALKEMAAAGGGHFTRVTADDRDLDIIFAKSNGSPSNNPLQNTGLAADQWVDMGPWLVIAVALIGSVAFRRGWIAVVLLTAGLSSGLGMREAVAAPPGETPPPMTLPDDATSTTQPPQPAPRAGLSWDTLWQTRDQQGASAFKDQDYGTALRRFENPAWQASSVYRSGDYETATAAFSQLPDGDYNRGNALARGGKLEDAVKAYDAAIAADPANEDAIYNRDLVQNLINQRKQDEQKNDDGKGQGQSQSQSEQQKQDGKDGKSKDQKDQNGKGEKDPKDQKDEKDQAGDQGPKQPDPKGAPDKKQAEDKSAPPKPETPPQQPGDAPKDPKADAPPKSAAGKPAPPDPKPPASPPPPAPGAGKQAEPQPPKDPPPPAQAPPQPAQAGKKEDTPPPPDAPKVVGSASEQDQNSEQSLRMVPDDPTGLLRARIRSHYLGSAVPVTAGGRP